MPLSQRWTLTRYLIEERRRFPQAGGDLNALILDVSLACKAIARIVAFGTLGDTLTAPAAPPVPEQLATDVFVRMTEWGGHLAGMADTALRQIPEQHPRGKYLLVFDALDGGANADVNAPMGSIFSILRSGDTAAPGQVGEPQFLQAGSSQVAAGYAIYGATTMFVLTVGNGVAGFTLNPNLGEFVLTHPHIQVPQDSGAFAIDTSNSRFWEPPVKRYVDECAAGAAGPRGRDFDMRWVASLVAEAHSILLRGGVFLQPHDLDDDPQASSRRRLLHEANPIAYLVEQAGGRASTGRQPVLGLVPTALQQRVGLVFGSRAEVERIERYYRDPAGDSGVPLFAERSLFRT